MPPLVQCGNSTLPENLPDVGITATIYRKLKVYTLPFAGWEMDTIFTLEALGVCWGLESFEPPQDHPVDTGVGHE